jgi:Ca2+-binding EF-hand superfamily protein
VPTVTACIEKRCCEPLLYTLHTQLDKEELNSLKAAFLEFDSEQNGIISYAELHSVLVQHGVDDTEIQTLFSSMDQDR